MKRAMVFLALLPLLLTTGCISNTIRQKQEQLCKNLSVMNTSIAAVRKVNDTVQSSGKTLKQTEEQVTAAFNTLKTYFQDAPEEAKVDLEQLEFRCLRFSLSW